MADYNEPHNRSHTHYPDDGVVHTRQVTADEVAYRNAYVRGQDSQRVRQHGRQNGRQIRTINHEIERERLERDRNKTAIGLLLGIALASAIGLLAAIFYFASRKDEARIIPVPAPTIQPQTSTQPTSSQPASTQSQPTQGTRIIQNLRQVPVERPTPEVESAPSQQQPQQQIVAPAPADAPNNTQTNAPANPPTGAPSAQSTNTPNQPEQQPTAPQGNSDQVQNNTGSNPQPSENLPQPQAGQEQPETEAQSESSEANSYQIELPGQ